MTTTLIDLIRHGEPEGGPMFRGQTDHALSEQGWQQMRRAITPEDHWDVIVTSPLLRCTGFAREMADRLGVPMHTEQRLQEIGFGDWEGHTTDQVMATWGDALQQFWSNPVAYPPPGGETLADFRKRVSQAWAHWTQALAGQRVLVVCHGGVIRMVLAEILETPLEAAFRTMAVPYASRSRIRLDESPHGRLACLLSHGSLQG
ncbi:histidine phosphatase family protein [Marinobacter lacisalsi]|uniref:phosphoglycerate mutase (2,3-diphosphoglycerate-dependent) n=1 Tax=Marinobacter lacisalsi TaxID=475979 RepID=A0ABV8QMJ8_9GAMM